MARVSRKGNTPKPVVGKKCWPTASYSRLSVKDNGQNTDESIVNQEKILSEFIDQYPELELTDKYADNGNTGTDFERPEWERLMENVRRGRIKCIIVKDLSRLGRNYIEAGDYVEKVFPFLGVRFIAINDRYDSEHIIFGESELVVSLRNMVNDFYSKDISKKVKSSFQTKKNNGEFIGSAAPYGYKLLNGQLYPDDNTKDIVVRIFDLKRQGISSYKIAQLLNEEEIPCPSRYKYLQGSKKYARYESALWQDQAVSRILKDEVYIGTKLHRFDKSIYSIRKGKMPEEQWERYENSHEPLVDAEVFGHVQDQLNRNKEQRRQYETRALGSAEDVLKGILKCGYCKKSIRRNKEVKYSYGKSKLNYYFYCATQYNYAGFECNHKRIKDTKVYEVVYQNIMLQIQLAIKTESLYLKMQDNHQAQESKWLASEQEEINRAIARTSFLKKSLYERLKNNEITKEEYSSLKCEFENRLEQLSERKADAIRQLDQLKRTDIKQNRWLQNCLKFTEEKRLTREMVVALLVRVELYGTDRMEITYKFKDDYNIITEYLQGKGVMQGVS